MSQRYATRFSPCGVLRAIGEQAFLLGVANGALFHTGLSFADGSAVVLAFIEEFTQSEAAVGAMLAVAGWLLPQLVVADYA